MKDNKQAIFNNMGCSMLYRVAVPSENGFKLLGNVLMVDSLGKTTYYSPKHTGNVNMGLSKLNTGALSWVKKGESYSLYLLDNESKWQIHETKFCSRDSIIEFKKVPKRAFYRLLKNNGDQRLERIFTYENNKQVWW